jgi:plastocyanin
MADDLKAGDKVKWKSHGGQAHGRVVKKQTSETQIKSHTVKASPDNPQFIVETQEGKRAAHKPEALTRE